MFIARGEKKKTRDRSLSPSLWIRTSYHLSWYMDAETVQQLVFVDFPENRWKWRGWCGYGGRDLTFSSFAKLLKTFKFCSHISFGQSIKIIYSLFGIGLHILWMKLIIYDRLQCGWWDMYTLLRFFKEGGGDRKKIGNDFFFFSSPGELCESH